MITMTDYCVLHVGLHFLFQDRRCGRDQGRTHHDSLQENSKLIDKHATESGDSSGYESSAHDNNIRWRMQKG